MFLKIEEEWIRLIGDPHLGKKFQNGVPLHRRGEREQQQFEEFERQLLDVIAPDGKIVKAVICVGDLFDGAHVSNEALERTYDIMSSATKRGLVLGVEYLVLMGNHDITRNSILTSSFDILSLMNWSENVGFVRSNYVTNINGSFTDPIILCPYNAFVPTSQLFTNITADFDHYSAAIGHWDTVSFGGNDHNLLPYNIAPFCDVIITGHEHNPRTFEHEGTKIIVTGSMLPYSFAEDKEEKIYVTRTLNQYLEDPTLYKDKCLRILLEPGQLIPEDMDALSLSFKFIDKVQAEETKVVMDEFNLKDLFIETFKENNVPEEKIKTYWGKYTDATSA